MDKSYVLNKYKGKMYKERALDPPETKSPPEATSPPKAKRPPKATSPLKAKRPPRQEGKSRRNKENS